MIAALIKSGARNGVKFQIGFQIGILDRDPEMCHVNENTLTILYLLTEGSPKFSHIFYIFRLGESGRRFLNYSF